MLKTYDPLKVNVAFNSRQLRMRANQMMWMSGIRNTKLTSGASFPR